MSFRGGRGRGSGMTLNTEFLGLNRGDLPPAAVSPPPLFPVLTNKCLLIRKGEKEAELSRYHQSLAEEMRASQTEVLRKINWNNLPKELKVGAKKRTRVFKPKLEKRSKIDLEEQLQKLEAKEKDDSDREEEEAKKDSDDEEKKEDLEEELDEEDEEMDGGTDYANNYFDNGEGFNEEDDNLDEGGVY